MSEINPSSQSVNANNNKNTKKEIYDWLKTIAIAVIVGLLLRLLVFEVVVVEQSSMFPTLKEGQKLFLYKLSYTLSEPKRADIVVLKVSERQNYVKRVIALEGETIEIKDSRVYINGKLLEEDYLPEGLSYADFAPVCVPEGCIFVMGDNRPYSLDSRSDAVGFIDTDNIVGRVLFSLSPFTLFSR